MVVESAVSFSAVASVGFSLMGIVLSNEELFTQVNFLGSRICYYSGDWGHPVLCQEVPITLLLEYGLEIARD